MAFEGNKRRKIDEPLSHGIQVSSNTKKEITIRPSTGPLGSPTQTSGVNFTTQQAKFFAAAEAQKDGCTGNYRLFDSPFGNFLVPVVPTRAELAKTYVVKEGPKEATHERRESQVTRGPKPQVYKKGRKWKKSKD